MNNEKVYLIHEEDYVKHIDEKVMLYSFVQQLTHHIGKLKPTRANEAIKKAAQTYAAAADNLFDSWGIPKSYLVFEDRDALSELMENELIEPEDAGFIACDCGGERCCDFCDRYCGDDCDSEDYEYECDEEEFEEKMISSMMADLSEIVHNIFGDSATISINIG